MLQSAQLFQSGGQAARREAPPRAKEAQVAQSERQTRILAYIHDYLDEHGYPPTIREIGRRVGISSTSVVNYHLNKLKDQGLVERDGRVSRGLKLGRELARGLSGGVVPLMGIIQAGEPIPVLDERSAESPVEWVEVAPGQVPSRGRPVYALRVKGESMNDALINDGDIVIMESADTAENGDMVAAWIKDREVTTLKRFFREDGMIRLQPANPTMAPIREPSGNVQVQGRVVAVIRNLIAA